MNEVALVLEGGGMRGVFTAGVLDCFLRAQVYFSYVVATSAGTSNGLSYASRQLGRAHYCNIETLRKYNYIGLKFLFSQRCIMDYKYLYGYLPLVENPFDFQTYLKSGRFVLTATSCETGEAVYFDTPKNEKLLLDVCKASCSMPLFCPIAYVEGKAYLDGGISDAIPIKKAISDGNKKIVVVLTRPQGYRKKEDWRLLSLLYWRYPNLRKALCSKADKYNSTMDFIEKLEQEGKIFVIRPETQLAGRLNANPDALESFYQEGISVGNNSIEKMKNFLLNNVKI